MIAESVPPARELATRPDEGASVVALRRETKAFREEVATTRAEVLAAISESNARLRRRMLTFFAPAWVGVWGTLVAIILTR